MQHIHENFIQIAINNARAASGNVSPNPMVGALIVHNQEIIGQGIHEKFGGPHAEVNAVQSVDPKNKSRIKDSTIYVSLEPCNHYGKTGPCTELILKHEIKKLVFACFDPNPQMSGKSIQYLKNNNVEVIGPVCETEANALILPFAINQQHKRPYIILKFAQSADLYLGDYHKRIKISHPHTDLFVHQWRNEVDAILVGSNTVLIDDPALTTRYNMGKNPRRIVLDRRNRLTKEAYQVFNDDYFLEVPLELQNDLPSLMKYLYENQIGILMVEGGKKILDSFIQHQLYDEIRVIRSKKIKLKEGIDSPQFTGKVNETIDLINDVIYYIRH